MIHVIRFFCKKQTFYELLFFLNIFILIIIAYIYSKLKIVEEKLELERIRKNKINAKYNFIEMLETMSEKDLEYIQSTFDTGEMVTQDKKYYSHIRKLYTTTNHQIEKKNKLIFFIIIILNKN